jgi:non-specific protein-tyrosine kinase
MTITIAATLATTPKYRASTMMRVLAVSGGGGQWITYDTRQTERLMNTYAEYATSWPVLTELVNRLELNEEPQVEVGLLAGTELMQITVEALNPLVARDAANTLAEILMEQSRAMYLGSGKSAQEILGEQLAQLKSELDQAWGDYEQVVADFPEDSERITAASRTIELKEASYAELLAEYERNRVREAVLSNTLSVIEPAVAPSQPARPRVMFNLALSTVLGLLFGIGFAFLVDSLDTTLHSTEQIARTSQLPILGSIPNAGKHEQPALYDGVSPQGEAFRRLRTSLFMLDRDLPLRTLLVTSAEPREGKSTVLANLGHSVSESGRSVLLVDAQFHLPVLHKLFELSNRVGLSSVLEGKVALAEAVQDSANPGIRVLTSGPLPAQPAELLSSPQMTDLVEQFAQQYDMVFLDTPSVLAVIDAGVLAHAVDGVVFVVERGQAQQDQVRAARQQLEDSSAKTIGVVVNRTGHDSRHDYYRRVVA